MSMLAGHLDRLDELSVRSSHEGSSNTDSRSNSLGIDSSVNDSTNGGKGMTDETDIMGRKVKKQVMCLKLMVLFTLIAAAAMVGTAVYLTTQRGEEKSFEQEFYNDAAKVFETFQFNFERKFGAIDALSLSIASLAVDVGATWPMFTIPDFEYRASSTMEIAEAASVNFLPLVQEIDRLNYEAYVQKNLYWVEDGIEFFDSIYGDDGAKDSPISPRIFRYVGNQTVTVGIVGPYFPFWQHYPVDTSIINYDLLNDPNFFRGVHAMLETRQAVVGRIWDFTQNVDAATLSDWVQASGLKTNDPLSKIYYPVTDISQPADEQGRHPLVAMLAVEINWSTFFRRLLPPEAKGVIVVLKNGCNQTYTYSIDGEYATILGEGDLHEKAYEHMKVNKTLQDILESGGSEFYTFSETTMNNEYCPYSLDLYPSARLESEFTTDQAVLFTVTVVVIFAFTGALFLLYDWIVERRQAKVMKRAVQSRALVSSLFPAAVRDRLFRGADDSTSKNKGQGFKRKNQTNNKLKKYMDTGLSEQKPHELRPIADLFPHTTVMFADIAGFTRWSSERDPAHVFTLLQTVYHAFDRIAKKRGVFKVETIGDCYVAVTGLPDPQEDHALRMAKFASECMKKFTEVVNKLKETLGEDTADLAMRFGLHSGPVTAGVLRGEKSRFQLFGNTVNTAARMENSGEKNRIQVSQETADLITEAGKGHWIFLRIDDIAARGGIQTYWVEPQTQAQEAKFKNANPTRLNVKTGTADSSERLIDWNVDLLKRLLKRIVANRRDKKLPSGEGYFAVRHQEGTTVRDEISEVIYLPKYDKFAAKTDPETIDLGKDVEQQLRDYITSIEAMYHDNPFHNFKHASNVCTNANKMLNSIVDDDIYQRISDPLTQFAVVFSALIHDVDHLGITNMLLIKEKPHLAALYRNKSVAEQNSVDLAWNLFMDPQYEKLHDTLFGSNFEFKRFRQIVVNVVMATDIFDKELNGDRLTRWKKAFNKESRTDELDPETEGNLKATVIIEHVMQLADVMHTMQHFHSYQRWNERLFEEMYLAFESGRSPNDPSQNWYQGEIWFFDNCVIPIAQTIRDTGILGATGEDCVRNAISNKKEWSIKGNEIVQGLTSRVLNRAEEPKEEETKKEEKEAEQEKEKKSDPNKHLIEWNVDLLKRLLRQITAARMAEGIETREGLLSLAGTMKEGSTVRDEIVKLINLPLFDREASKLKVDPDTIELSKAVQDQLRDYVCFIASMYKENEFHNFKHASNVAMAANKYLQRITEPIIEKQVSHPLTQFAVIFSSLIHDVDHPGVPNETLVAEGKRLAVVYNNKSVAEQNSTDLAWSVLMDAEYKDLQAAIYGSQEELQRFRNLVVNAVMATDLFDEELIADRNERWLQAFSDEHRVARMSDADLQNLRATIIVEHVMIAANVAHTMQHFHSYRRWNERLYFEMYEAFETGRSDKDPSTNWYEQEIQFFDRFIIPLATKLKDCGVFGIAGDDALRCGQANRKEWVVKGGDIVKDLKKKYLQEKKEKEEQKEKDKEKENK